MKVIVTIFLATLMLPSLSWARSSTSTYTKNEIEAKFNELRTFYEARTAPQSERSGLNGLRPQLTPLQCPSTVNQLRRSFAVLVSQLFSDNWANVRGARVREQPKMARR